ncbi:transcriptional regulator [Ammoniphilus sp. 3BR4]|uniref:transcriptional regulator n=1 Tax=Ammoniphilus sp. 3BR4 TaxID=3158265 RepID=UPI00346553BB
MEIRVTVFGSPDLVQLVEQIAAQFEELTLFKAVYDDPHQVIDLVNKHHHHGDILLFAAPIPYLITKDYLERNDIQLHKPLIFVPYLGTSIYPVLFKTLKDFYPKSTQDITFSIDFLPRSELRDCLEELLFKEDQMFIKECDFDQDLSELVSFHYQLWKSGKILVALTTFYHVYQKLLELGVRAYQITPTRSSMRTALKQVLLEGKSLHQLEGQIAIGIIGFSHNEDAKKGMISEYQLRRKKLALEQMLLDYGEEIQALINWSDHGEIRFITTRGKIKHNTNFFQKIPILSEIQIKLNLSAFLGIGFGSTANEAEMRAYEAFSKAKSRGSGSCFVVELDGQVQGPIGKSSNLKYSVRSSDPDLLSISKQVGLSIATINKLLSLCDNADKYKMTAFDLASRLGITQRSARRILNKLEENKFAEIVGEEQPINKGRPRQIYTLTLQR